MIQYGCVLIKKKYTWRSEKSCFFFFLPKYIFKVFILHAGHLMSFYFETQKLIECFVYTVKFKLLTMDRRELEMSVK